jgi:tRNA A37 methylthiotransferase MiaB
MPSVGKHRNAEMRKIFQQSAIILRLQHLEQDLQVLWEKASPTIDHQWELSGLSDNYLRVRTTFSLPCRNQIMNVHITGVEQDGLVGEITPT